MVPVALGVNPIRLHRQGQAALSSHFKAALNRFTNVVTSFFQSTTLAKTTRDCQCLGNPGAIFVLVKQCWYSVLIYANDYRFCRLSVESSNSSVSRCLQP